MEDVCCSDYRLAVRRDFDGRHIRDCWFRSDPSCHYRLPSHSVVFLYDTVMVFDKIRENTQNLAGIDRERLMSVANLATLNVSSFNATSIVGILPNLDRFCLLVRNC